MRPNFPSQAPEPHPLTSRCHSSVNLTEDGRQALLKLSKGDMRRALNILQVCLLLSPRSPAKRRSRGWGQQACHAAYDVTDETAIYNCTGNPHPADIDEIMRSMMNDSFETSYRCASPVPVPWASFCRAPRD